MVNELVALVGGSAIGSKQKTNRDPKHLNLNVAHLPAQKGFTPADHAFHQIAAGGKKEKFATVKSSAKKTIPFDEDHDGFSELNT